jgi:2-polyprenyl-3-methyl-5-hydroxy-6-metoxy-1,4-benzoquinol methylase
MWNRIKRAVTSRIIKRWGPADWKGRVWDAEFSSGQWDYLELTNGDPVYAYVEKYLKGGSILDLGCGSGNTGNELSYAKYERYTGTDLSDVAIRKAKARTKANAREAKNEYVCCNMESYVPTQSYDVILFRESIFYIPLNKIQAVLDRYKLYLKAEGVFIVRLCDRDKYLPIVDLISRHYFVRERHSVQEASDIVIVFGTRHQSERYYS